MSNKLALICGLDVRVSTEDLNKLTFISDSLNFGSNKSKAVRYLISEYAEVLAYQSHQQEEVEQYECT